MGVLRYWEIKCQGPQCTNQLCNLFLHLGIWLPRPALEWDGCTTLDKLFVKVSKVVGKSYKKSCEVPAHWIRPSFLPKLYYLIPNTLLICTLLCWGWNSNFNWFCLAVTRLSFDSDYQTCPTSLMVGTVGLSMVDGGTACLAVTLGF